VIEDESGENASGQVSWRKRTQKLDPLHGASKNPRELQKGCEDGPSHLYTRDSEVTEFSSEKEPGHLWLLVKRSHLRLDRKNGGNVESEDTGPKGRKISQPRDRVTLDL